MCTRCRWRRWPSVPGSADPSCTSTSPTATSSWLLRTGGKRRSCTPELASEVAAAGSVEEMYRALLRGSIRATVERGQIFTALRAAGRWNRDIRREQRSRDRDTVRAFAAVAARQYGLDAQTFHLGHGRAVGRARGGPGAMASRSKREERNDPRGDVPGHGRRRLFGGVCEPLGVRGHLSVSLYPTAPTVRFGLLRPEGLAPWR